MKKKFRAISIFLCLCLLLGACAKGPGGNNPGADMSEEDKAPEVYKLEALRPTAYSNIEGLSLEPGATISIIGRHAHNSYWKEVEKGARKAVSDLNELLGYKGSDEIKLSYSAPEVSDDVDGQVNLLDEELARYPAAIGIATIDSSACKIQFDLAAENSIPIVTFDSGNEYQHIAAHISTDNMEAAKTATHKLAEAMEKEGEVAIFVQDSVSTTATQRVQGFLETIKASYPKISVVHVYYMDQLEAMQKTISDKKKASLQPGEQGMKPETVTQEDVVRYVLEQFPNLKGVYATNLETTQLVGTVLSSLKITDLNFVGFDGGKEQMKLIESNVLDGIILQNPYAMGYATVVAAIRTTLGLPNESFVNSGFTWVTAINKEDKGIKPMLY